MYQTMQMAACGGVHVKGYVLLKELGSGSYATVYKAHRSVSYSYYVRPFIKHTIST